MVEKPSERFRRPSGISGSGRETLTEVRELTIGPPKCPGGLSDILDWSGCPPGGPGVVGRPSQRSGNGWEALPGGPGVVGRPSRIFRSGRETRTKVREL